MKRFFAFLFFLLNGYILSAQQFGGNPSSVKWQQINTDTVRVIFPKGFDAGAQRIANIIHSIQRNTPHTIGDSLRKISIVIQNQALLSNGYVGLAPYRSEFYTTPPQNPFELGAVNWTDNLAVHEFRHVQQFSNFNKGLSRLATFILGEQGQLVANAMAIPDWFFEGDAVFNETRFTQQGRGALPFFMSSYRSLFQANRNYSYMKLRNGSLRNYVPDHYNLGYLLVAYGRKQYGDGIWQKVTDDAARFKPLFYPFQGALKKQTGKNFTRFVHEAMGFYQNQWSLKPTDAAEWVTKTAANDIINYQYPYTTADGALIVVKTSRRNPPAFYTIHPDGSEQKIAGKAIAGDAYFSYNNGRIVYAATQPDTRWGNRSFQSIRQLDIATGEETIWASRTRYFSPDISHDGKLLLAVEMDPSGSSRLVWINQQGIERGAASQPGIVFSHPKFAADDAHAYVAARNMSGEMALLKYDLVSGKPVDTLLPFYNRIIGFPVVQGDTILFSTTYQGKDEAWAFVDGKNKKGAFRLASYSTGIYQAVVQPDGKVLASTFTADGYRLARFIPEWERVAIKDELTDLCIPDVFPGKDHGFLTALPSQLYAVEKYPQAFHLLNLHSFRPYYEQPEYSLTVYGQNVLNTFQSQLAYTYNQNEKSHKLGYNGVYGGSYLQPVFGISNTWQRTGLLNKDTSVNWNELVGYAGLQLPLNFTGGRQYRFLTLSSTYNINQVSWTGLAQKLFANRSFQYLQTRISFLSQAQKGVQQIYPHFAQSLVLQYKNSISNYMAHQFLATGSLFLPGLSNNHSLVLSAAFHSRDTLQQYLFSNSFPFARGYSAVDYPRMWKIGINYHLPLAYPDWGFGNLVYFLRIRSNFFFDYTEGKSLRTGIRTPYRTAGTELYFDTRWWNQQPVTFGIRYSRLLDNEFRGATQPNVWEFLLPINLFN